MLPDKFQQIYVRLYWKGSKFDDIEKQNKIIDAFSKLTGKNCYNLLKHSIPKFIHEFLIMYFVFLLKLKIINNSTVESRYDIIKMIRWYIFFSN